MCYFAYRCPVVQAQYWTKIVIWIALQLCQKSIDHICEVLYPESLFYSNCICVYSFTNTTGLEYYIFIVCIKTGNCESSKFVGFFPKFLSIPVSLHTHTHTHTHTHVYVKKYIHIYIYFFFFFILFIYFWLCWVFGSCEGFL